MAVLDTTCLIDWMKEIKRRRPGKASAKAEELLQRGEALRITVFTIGELYVGVAKGAEPEQEETAIAALLDVFEVVGFEESTARIFGMLVGRLEVEGRAIADIDSLIASVALERNELFVTRNVKHFARVPGLQIESYSLKRTPRRESILRSRRRLV
jgi:predicted nucleic acid-binding protein